MAMATKILGYGGTLVAAAAAWAIGIEPLVDRSLDIARNNSSVGEAATGAQYIQQAADWSPLWVLLIAMVGLLAAAIFRSERR